MAFARVGEEFPVNIFTGFSQERPVAVPLSGGRYVVLWQSGTQDGSGNGIYGRIQTAGDPLSGTEFRVNTATEGNQETPALARLGSGGFVAFWESADGDGTGVFARLYDANGAASGGQFRLNVFVGSNQEEPQGAAIGDGRWVAVWQSIGQDGSGRGVIARIFGGGDAAGGEEFVVNTTVFGVQERPVVAGLGDGGFVVAWQSAFQEGPNYGIFAQRFAADGTRIGDEFGVNTITAGQQQAPAIVALPDGGFFVAWETESLDGDGFAIAGRRFNAAGLAAAPEFQINTTTASNQTDPHLALTATGGLVVTWESNGQDGSGTAVVAQRFNPNFTRNGGEIVANTFQTFFQENPVSVATPSGFVTLWQTFGKETGIGIYAQDFASTDTLPVFRFYNFATGGHFYTAGADERDHIRATIDTFVYEGVAFGAAAQPATGTAPLWRFYNSATGTHFFTISIDERDFVRANYAQFQYEGKAFDAYATEVEGTIPVWRFYNDRTGTHFYTANEEEKVFVESTFADWKLEGIGYYAEPVFAA